jgi:glycosyltransferase involved in cell wall biosynthesis
MFADERIPKEEARRRLGLSLDVPVLLFFGIVREYKGLRDILEALPKIQARLGKVILLVAGEFWEDERLYLEVIKRLGIGDSVVIEDRYILNEEVPLYFSAADVLVAPYRRVTGSGVVRMALGCGCPVITTAVGGLVDLVRGRENGLLVPPSDSATLAAAVARYFAEELAAPMTRLVQSGDHTSSWLALLDAVETARCTASI